MIKLPMIGLALLVPALASACFGDIGGYDGYGMMGYSEGHSFFMVAGGLVWIVVGILAGVWLWQNISKKKIGNN